jgi:P-type E1-E2 ATPase
VASGLAVIAGLPELGVAIAIVIVVNGVFAFAQEFRAERAAEKLRDLLPHRTTVIRDGIPVPIDAADVVVGDLVALAGGDRVSADVRLVDASGVLVDTSTLTGESTPDARSDGDEVAAGTFVVLVAGALFVGVPAIADLLEHRPPPAGAWPLIVLSVPVILAVDGLWKRRRARRSRR